MSRSQEKARYQEDARTALTRVREAREHRFEDTVRVEELELSDEMAADLERFFEERAGETDEELTTTEAARLLRISRPKLINLLEAGEIPFRKVGSHRRVRRSDVLGYAETMERPAPQTDEERARRRRALEEMARISHEAGEGS